MMHGLSDGLVIEYSDRILNLGRTLSCRLLFDRLMLKQKHAFKQTIPRSDMLAVIRSHRMSEFDVCI